MKKDTFYDSLTGEEIPPGKLTPELLARAPIRDYSPRDREWLRQQVTALFEDEKGKLTPDHAVCAKYAEILLKLMPPEPPSAPQLSDRMRRLLSGTAEGGSA